MRRYSRTWSSIALPYISVILVLHCFLSCSPQPAYDYEADSFFKLSRKNGCSGAFDTTNIGRLSEFIKTWGLLHYRHPNTQSDDLDHNRLFLEYAGQIIKCSNNEDFKRILVQYLDEVEHFRPFTITTADENEPMPCGLFWLSNSVLKERLLPLMNNVVEAPKHIQHQKKFPILINFPKDDALLPGNNGLSKAQMLLGLGQYWNMINFFYPYQEMLDTCWDKRLETAIFKILQPGVNDSIYHYTFMEMRVGINDAHSVVISEQLGDDFGLLAANAQIETIEGKCIVTGPRVPIGYPFELERGDVIIRFNDQPVEVIRNRRLPITCASNKAGLAQKLDEFLLISKVEKPEVVFIRGADTIRKTIMCYPNYKLLKEERTGYEYYKGKSILKWFNEIGYIDMELLSDLNWKENLPEIKKCKALILDLRGYPHDMYRHLCNLFMPESKTFAFTIYPEIKQPGKFRRAALQESVGGGSAKECLNIPIALLVDETTISHAEYTVMALQMCPNVVTVGSQSAGADGNIIPILLAGGITTYISGLGIYYDNGQSAQGQGVKIDYWVEKNARALMLGQDLPLESALNILKERY